MQPVIIIPTASKECNDKWDYASKARDWECTCAEGKQKSPINLPKKDDAVLSDVKPILQYDIIQAKSLISRMDGLL